MNLYKKSKKGYKFYITVSLSVLFMITTLISVGFGALNQDLSVTGDVEYTEPPVNMIKAYNMFSTTDFHISTYKTKIKTVNFVNNKNIPNNAVASWDVSAEANSGKVMAWIIDDPNNSGYYKLYIGAIGGVTANPDSSYIFSGLFEVTSITFGSYYNTSQATNMSNMFSYCYKLTSLDLTGFNTSQVTNMSSMFYCCEKLTSLNLSSFDTSQVTDMSFMFNHCDSITSLSVTSFKTTKVTRMDLMFSYCLALTQIKISSSWNVSNVTNSNNMFNGSTNLPNYNASYVDKTMAKPTTQGGYMTLV